MGQLALHRWPILLCVSVAACGPYPRDMDGTLDRVERTQRFTVGLSALSPADERIARRYVARLERATGSKARIEEGPLERHLVRLETGDVDLVIAEIAEQSPWATPVSLIEPLRRRREGKHRLGLSPVAANGENRWVALLEREVRNSAGQSSE